MYKMQESSACLDGFSDVRNKLSVRAVFPDVQPGIREDRPDPGLGLGSPMEEQAKTSLCEQAPTESFHLLFRTSGLDHVYSNLLTDTS